MFFDLQLLQDNLISAGYVGNVNQNLKDFLVDEGYSKPLNESLEEFLAANGYTGVLNEMGRDWGLEGCPLSFGISGAFSSAFGAGFDG